MDRNRLMMFAALGTAVVVLVLGFLVGVQPQLSAASDAREQQVAVEAQNETLGAAIAQLRVENEGLPALEAQLATLQAALPATAAVPAFIDEVGDLADGADVTVTDMTMGDAQAYAPPVATETPVETVDSDGAAVAPTTDPAADAAGSGAPAVVTDPAVTADNFSSVPVTITVEGSYESALRFLGALRDGDRLFALSAFSSDGETSGSSDDDSAPSMPRWTVTGSVFVLLDASSAPVDGTTTPSAQAEGASAGDTAAGE